MVKIDIWECPDCNFQMVQDKKHVDSGGHKKYGCPICELERIKRERDACYWFVKRYYTTFLHYHGKREDISHNEQFFIYGDANSIIGEIEGKAPNGANVEVAQCFKNSK